MPEKEEVELHGEPPWARGGACFQPHRTRGRRERETRTKRGGFESARIVGLQKWASTAVCPRQDQKFPKKGNIRNPPYVVVCLTTSDSISLGPYCTYLCVRCNGDALNVCLALRKKW
jgi:hypothetical protein